MKYESATNRRLRNPSHAQELATEAVHQHVQAATVSDANATSDAGTSSRRACRVVLGLGPGRSGTKSLTELLAAQIGCVHAEHEMVVKRRYRRDESGRVDPSSTFVQHDTGGATLDGNSNNDSKPQKKKGSWGSDRRLEWDAPRLVRGAAPLTEQEEATWRVLRLLEQRYVFDEWVSEEDAESNGHKVSGSKPRKLGARGWRKYNSNGEEGGGATFTEGKNSKHDDISEFDAPVVAAVSSAGLAYVHECVALDPTIRIVVLMRPREEVVESFLKKSKGRNHWQRHERRRRSQDDTGKQSTRAAEYVQPDKTWDSAFPNMSEDECRQFILVAGNDGDDGVTEDGTLRPDKASAIRAYWELYNAIAQDLFHQYPLNVRVFDMSHALNDASVQEGLLRFCGFDEPVFSAVHLNKKKK